MELSKNSFTAIVLSVLIIILLNPYTVKIPLINEILGFFVIAFLPGFLCLKITGTESSDKINMIIYSLGLSLTIIILTGFLLNMILPMTGHIPITPLNVKAMIISILLVLLSLSYKKFDETVFEVDIRDLLSPANILLCCIPFIVIIGVYLRNHGITAPLLLIIPILSILPLFVALNRIPQRSYPLAVFVIAISLLFHTSLISNYIWGWDIQIEYYLSKLVLTNGFWDSSIPEAYNAMLSIVILAPIFSIFCKINPLWVFKVIYPFIFSFVPLGLYQFFRKNVNEKISFFAVFFFMSLFVFFTEMIAVARQQIAELFLVLLLLLLVDYEIKKMKRALLFVLFSFSLAVSHYGLSYIFMLMLLASLMIIRAVYGSSRLIDKIFSRMRMKGVYEGLFDQTYTGEGLLTATFALLFSIFAITWYMYISGSSIFAAVVNIGSQIASSVFTEFLDPNAAQGLAIITTEAKSPIHIIGKYIHILFQFLIVVGMLAFLKTRKIKMDRDYVIFAYIAFFICIASLTVPYFASALNTTRVYQITLFFLAPFCVLGAMAIFSRLKYFKKNPAGAFSILLAIFLLFNTGWIYTVFNDDEPSSFAIDKRVDYPYFTNGEITGGKWVVSTNNETIYADEYRRLLFLGLSPNRGKSIAMNTTLGLGSYIYLGKRNLQTKEFEIYKIEGVNKYLQSTKIKFYQRKSKKIYDNGDSVILQL